MAIKMFNLPDPGEGLVEAEIVEWKVKPGDSVKVNDVVLEIETAKSLVELPIPWAGTVAQLLVEVGQTIDVGTPIISIDDGLGGDDAPAVAPSIPGERAQPADSGEGAILVGYGAKAGATARRARKAPSGGVCRPPRPRRRRPPRRQPVAAAPPVASGPSATRPPLPPPTASVACPTVAPVGARGRSRRCASSPRTSASTLRRSRRQGPTGSSPAMTSTRTSRAPRRRNRIRR